MDNKKKPSTLKFVPDHHSFGQQGITFTKEMLEWPLLSNNIDGKGIKNELLNIHHNAFLGLTQISPFEAKVSIELDTVAKKFIFSKRTWGEIYLENNCILCFSQDTRKDNYAFYCLTEWPELECDRVENINVLNSWTADMWSDFFRKRILVKAKALRAKAEAKRNDVLDLEQRADVLFYALVNID